jgi:hypothetical protein
MPYYLKWSAHAGSVAANNDLLQITGITGAISHVRFTVKETPAAYISNMVRVLFDVRRLPGSTSDGGGVGYITQYGPSGTQHDSNNTSNHTINSASVTITQLFNNLVADDVVDFDVSATPSAGCIAIGAGFIQDASFYGLTISELIITDANGAHTINMSDSGGTGTSLTSTDSALTATLFGFPVDDSQWVQYGAVEPSISLSGVYAPGNAIGITFTNFDGIPESVNLSVGNIALNPAVYEDDGDYFFDLPALPDSGNSAAGLPFGELITVTATDPGP